MLTSGTAVAVTGGGAGTGWAVACVENIRTATPADTIVVRARRAAVPDLRMDRSMVILLAGRGKHQDSLDSHV